MKKIAIALCVVIVWMVIQHSCNAIFSCIGDDLVRNCSCRYDSNGLSIIFNLNKTFVYNHGNVSFVASYPSKLVHCRYNGVVVVCYFREITKSLEIRLTAVKDNISIRNSTIWWYSLSKCDCDWSDLGPSDLSMSLAPNSTKQFSITWDYSEKNGESIKEKRRVESTACIQPTGNNCSEICTTNYLKQNSCTDININDYNYNLQYDVCVKSSSSRYCINKNHQVCLYNQSLAEFYYKRFVLTKVTCEYDRYSNRVSLRWEVLDGLWESKEKHNFTYTFKDGGNDVILEGRTDRTHIEEDLDNAQIASVKLCLRDSCFDDEKNAKAICERRVTTRTSGKKNPLYYIIPILVFIIIIFAILLLYYRYKKKNADPPPIGPIIDSDLAMTNDHQDSRDSTIALAFYEEIREPQDRVEEVFDNLDLSHMNGGN